MIMPYKHMFNIVKKISLFNVAKNGAFSLPLDFYIIALPQIKNGKITTIAFGQSKLIS